MKITLGKQQWFSLLWHRIQDDQSGMRGVPLAQLKTMARENIQFSETYLTVADIGPRRALGAR